ncbi:ensconsin-like isoform X1 [Hordeum vulgare subsp. vulgare]|uniref:ensconsin-like isoform X1 n=1 Tax=Hordeum vulgare subsp. vulgare TaxID=112509 RepID=UPI00029699E9|nr:ensconsin-like isoform X1 [Hordeum vulgare subsp. vulgare]
MATCTQAQLAPPSPSASAMVTGPGTETGPWPPAPDVEPEEKEKPPASLAPVAKPGPGPTSDPQPKPSLSVPRTRMRARLSISATTVGSGAGKRRYAKVLMTEEEEEKLLDVRARHRSARKEVSARAERRKELLKRRDEILFRRRCLAARLTNGIVVLRADADHVRHQRLAGWRFGKPMPEEIVGARNRITGALVLFADTCKALDAGLDAFMMDFQRRKRDCPDQDWQQQHKGPRPSLLNGQPNQAGVS